MKINATNLIGAAKALLPLVPYGGQAAVAAQAVLDLVNDVKGTVEADAAEVEQLAASRAELERAVNAHADRTAASLS